MLKIKPNAFSLRANLVLSMLLMLLPLALSALLGYSILHKTVVNDFQDAAQKQKDFLVPLQNLQLAMLQVEIPLEEYLVSGSPAHLRNTQTLRQEVEADFARLLRQLEDEYATLAQRALDDWTALEEEMIELLATHESGDTAAFTASQSRLDSFQVSAHDKLEAIVTLIEEDIDADYLDATLGLERSEWIAGIAGGISILFMFLGIYYFSRTILNSVERLIEGAERFSGGDREHKIEIQIPPELNKVAEEFNKMIGIIRESEDQLVDMARHDRLTGLLNRLSYEELIEDAFARRQRMGEQLALITLDIDHFKQVNDTYGHDAGDEVLRRVSAILMDSVRTMDKVFRMGGEEFTILLPGATENSAAKTAERIREIVEHLDISADSHTLKVTVSLGFALASPGDDETPDSLGKKADKALYQAKETGRNKAISATT